MIKFEGALGEQVLAELRAVGGITHLAFRILYVACGVLLLFLAFQTQRASGIANSLPLAFMGLCCFFLPQIRTRLWWWWWKPSLIRFFGPTVKGEINETGVQWEAGGLKIAFKDFKAIKLSNDCAGFYVNQTEALPVARAWFKDASEWEEFTALVKPHVKTWAWY